MQKFLRTTLGLALATVLAFAFYAPAAHADAADDMKATIYQAVNPKTGASITTPWTTEIDSASAKHGYTTKLGSSFKAATKATTGLTAVHRLWHAKNVDFTEALYNSTRYKNAIKAGYVDQGATFYAASAAVSGRTQPINSYVKSGKHRLATAETGATLTKDGWKLEGVAFHATATNSAVAAPEQKPTEPADKSSKPTDVPAVEVKPVDSEAGSVAVGKASYTAPANAIYVSVNGNDASSGTSSSPVKTIQKGINLAPKGGTVVIRAGVYRETLTTTKAVTLQNYPKEEVWLDGSSPVTGWVADGKAWRKDGWTTRFDHSPTYTKGAADNTADSWRFLSKDYPMAAHPDQVFVDGAPLQQVQSRSQVKEGTFFLDESTSKLYIGTNPSGKTVEASTIAKAMNIRGADNVVRGIGVRRFAPSVWHVGAITIEQPGTTFENVIVADAATTGISVLRENVTLKNVTVTGSGMLGIHGRYSDNLTLTSVLSTKNNDERFNTAPVSGGAKIGQARGITVSDSQFSGNYGHGFWVDTSTYDTVLRQSDFSRNTGTGVFLELSAKAIVGDNTISGNKDAGIKVNNTSNVQIWNNTIYGNGRPLNIVQDARRNTDKNDPAVDKRQAWPDPTMPWTLGPVTIRNNVIANPTSAANCLLCVEDYSNKQSAEQMKITANGNVYGRAGSSQPKWIVVWSRANVNSNPYVFTTLADFKKTTGQESKGREYVGTNVVDENLKLVSSVKTDSAKIAEPLPADVAKAIGRSSGSQVLGAW